jgi:signal transduction histidine kinase
VVNTDVIQEPNATMPPPESATGEQRRLAVLRATGLLDSEVEEAFDRLTRLAVQTLGIAAAFISLVDENRDFYKSTCGFGEPLARELTGPTFCHYTIRSVEPLVIPDTAGDPQYRDVATVRTLGVGAYVGIPLVVEGEVIGAFCAIELHPRAWSTRDVGILRDLAAMALSEIALRSATHRSETSRRELKEANLQLEAQQLELEMTNQQLLDSAAELEILAESLADQAGRARAEHRRVETVLASISDAFFVLDAEWHFSYVNDRAEQLLFAPRSALLGHSVWELFPGAVGSTFEIEYRRAVATRVPSVFEEYFPPHEAWYEVRAYPAADGLSVYFQDVTIRHHVDEARAEHLRRAEVAEAEASQANQVKSEFLATMSHELRTPLNAILGYTNLLELEVSGTINEEQRGHLRRLRSSGEHLLALVNDVLDLSKLEAGEMTLDSVAASVDDAVRAAIDLSTPAARARGVLVEHETLEEGAAAYVGDVMRVRQILVNLLSNAIKFTETGGGVHISSTRTVTPPNAFRLTGDGPWTLIVVRDTGIGIAPDHQATVFEPFKQVVGGRTRVQGGTGLGLAISRRLARQMGGDLQLVSKPGAGSTFTLWLPATGDTDGVAESPEARGVRARPHDPEHRVHDLAAIGERLREDVEGILDAIVTRVRARLPSALAGTLSQADLEDHTLAFLTSIVQSLVIVDQTGGIESRLMEDGQRIQNFIAQAHGAQRAHLGWTETTLADEYAAIEGELTGRIGQLAMRDPRDAVLGTGIVVRLLAHARVAAIDGFRAARGASASQT